jgi:hypothetical protein
VLSEYAGNHERPITEWIFGAVDEYTKPAMERPHAEEMNWAYNPEWGEGSLTWQTHEEYGSVPVTIGDDLEWLKEMAEREPEANHYGELMVWHLSELPTEEQWEAFKRAFDSFEVNEPWRQSKPAKVYPLKLWLETVEVKTTRTVVF